MFAATAAVFTGLAASCCPRPFGRSGCVRTPTTAWREWTSALSAGTAKSGVPANTMRRGETSVSVAFASFAGQLGGVFFPIFLELLANALALQVGEVVDEELAVEVIHLMLHAHGKDVVAVTLELLPLAVEGAHANLGRPHNLIEHARHRQAAFFERRLILARAQYLGIDEDERLGPLLRHVNDQQALVEVHLSGGEAYPGRGIHRLEHVVDERLELRG